MYVTLYWTYIAVSYSKKYHVTMYSLAHMKVKQYYVYVYVSGT